MTQPRKKHHWTGYVVPVIVFLVLSMLYFAPQFQGEVLVMPDVMHYEGASGDIERHVAEYGEDPQWTGGMFGGMPSYMINFKIPTWMMRNVSIWLGKIVSEPTILVFMAMLCFWLMLLLWRANPWVAMVAAIAYGFSTYNILIIGAGHISKSWAIAYAPLLVGAIVYAYRGGNIWFGGALAALGAGLSISTNHPQIVYYFLLIILAFVINELVRAVKEKALARFGKVTAVMLLAAVLAVGANFATLYYTAHHTGDTTRGGSELVLEGSDAKAAKGLDLEYATRWSYGRTESFNMLIPDLTGGASNRGFKPDGHVAAALRPYNAQLPQNYRYKAEEFPGYWGWQPGTAGPTYIGASVLFLAVLGLFLLRGREKWWLLAVSVFGLFLAWGNNMMWFTRLMFDILPGYNKFRAVATALIIVQWSMPLIAALILMKLWKAEIPKQKLVHGVKWSLGITGGIALFFLVFGGSLLGFTGIHDGGLPPDIVEAMKADRAAMMRADSLRSLLFILLTAGTVMLFAWGKVKRGVMVAAIGVLFCVDLIPVDARFVSWSDFVPKRTVQIRPTEIDNYILADKEPGFRVANFSVDTFNDAMTSYYHRSVGGYHGAKLRRYDDLIKYHLDNHSSPAYNMLNTKYFIDRDRESGQVSVRLNPDANGAAWFVDEVRLVDNANEELEALYVIDNKRTAVADRRFSDLISTSVTADTTATIALADYKTNHLTYRYSSASDGVAVFSEIYYDKGWSAFIDGQPAPYFRADYVLRAMVLPAGEHTVEFVFRAPHFRAVSAVTLICSLIIIIGLAASAAAMIVKRRKDGTLPEGNEDGKG